MKQLCTLTVNNIAVGLPKPGDGSRLCSKSENQRNSLGSLILQGKLWL